MLVSPATPARETSAAIRPYSIAVAPLLSASTLFIVLRIGKPSTIQQIFDYVCILDKGSIIYNNQYNCLSNEFQ
jgi:hypothetical protein